MAADFLDALRPLFDCLTDGICVTDAEGRVLYANDALGRLLGPAAREAVNTSLYAPLCGGIEGAPCGADAAACELKTLRGPATAVTVAGKHAASGRDLRVRCLRVSLARAERRFVVVEDDTAAAELERRKENWRQMLAHDVRSPLTLALGAFRLFEEMGPDHPLNYGDIELIKSGVRSCRRIESHIDAYLETERLEQGALPVHPAPVDAARLIRELVNEHSPLAGAHRLTLTGGAPQGLAVRADPALLRRVLTNLIDNALKFTLPGGRIVVDASAGDGRIKIRVADDGPGISARDLPRIFDRYYQGSSGERRRGLGLGLTFCREALRAMGGEIAVESKEGEGSVFTVSLPRDATAGGSS